MLLPLLTKEFEEAEDVHRAGVGDKLSASVDELLRETVRALAKLAQLRHNQLPMVDSPQIHLVVKLMQPVRALPAPPRSAPSVPFFHLSLSHSRPLVWVMVRVCSRTLTPPAASALRQGSDASLGLKTECLELLNNLSDLPQTLTILENDGVIKPLVALIQLPDLAVEAAAAELLAKLAQVKEYQLQISREGTLPTLIELLHSSSAAAQLAPPPVAGYPLPCSPPPPRRPARWLPGAQAAPTHPQSAACARRGSVPWLQELGSGRPKVAEEAPHRTARRGCTRSPSFSSTTSTTSSPRCAPASSSRRCGWRALTTGS